MTLKEDNGAIENLKLFEGTNIHFHPLFDSNVSLIFAFCMAWSLSTSIEALVCDIRHDSRL